MHTLNFQPQFVDKIKRGEKCQTVRKPRVRPIQVGDTLRLYTGQRTKRCELIKEVICTEVTPIEIFLDVEMNKTIFIHDRCLSQQEIDVFARKDGFVGALKMFMFFFKDDDAALAGFDGHLIKWSSDHE